MNSIPKQQEGDGANAAAANGARSALEQTVLGVAPTAAVPSEQALSHTAAAGASPSEPSAHSTTEEPPAVVVTPVIVAAPMIAVSGSTPAELAEPSGIASADTSKRAAVDAAPPPALQAEPDAPVPPAPPERFSATPPYGTPGAGSGAEGQQSTVLNADYLRVAREVAFAQTSPSRGAAPEASPTTEAPGAVQATTLPGQAEDASISSFRPSWVPSTTGASSAAVGGATIRGFEPVPPVRAPLAESLSGGLMAVPDLGGRTLSRGTRPPPRPGANQRGDTKARWMLLCAVAFATVGVVSFGGRLLNRYRSTTERTRALAALEATSPTTRGGDAPGNEAIGAPRDTEDLGASGAASRALLANRPASERGSPAGRTTVVSASGSSDLAKGGAADSVNGATPNAAGAPVVASQESQLAATAARHMLAGSYAEALPVYRQLAREWPENSSYAAMARLLEKRVGTVNDTKTIAPAAP